MSRVVRLGLLYVYQSAWLERVSSGQHSSQKVFTRLLEPVTSFPDVRIVSLQA